MSMSHVTFLHWLTRHGERDQRGAGQWRSLHSDLHQAPWRNQDQDATGTGSDRYSRYCKPSGKHTKNDGKSPYITMLLMGKSTISTGSFSIAM